MPKYRVLQKSFIDNHLREAGETVDYDGLPSENLEPLDEAGEVKAQEAKAASAKLRETLVSNYSATDINALVLSAVAAATMGGKGNVKGKGASTGSDLT